METRRVLMRSLVVAVVIASVIWTTTAAPGGAQKPVPKDVCCTKVSSSVVTDPIISIRLQGEDLPCINAIVFVTEKGEFCSDPKQRWVREKVKQFINAKRNKPQTSTPPPTSSSVTVLRTQQQTGRVECPLTAGQHNTLSLCGKIYQCNCQLMDQVMRKHF